MTPSEKVNNIFRITRDNKIEFILQKEGESNFIDVNSESVTINLVDLDDKNLDDLLDKICQCGYDSLSLYEREVLNTYSKN